MKPVILQGEGIVLVMGDCSHEREQVTHGPTTDQINHWCPDCRTSWTTFPPRAATTPRDRIQPTYYVRRPGDTYSVADPQPTRSAQAASVDWLGFSLDLEAQAKRPPDGLREFLHALQARNEKDNGLFPQVASEVEADAKALRRVLAVLDFYHPLRTSGVAADERQQFEEAMGEALKAGQGEYALSRAHQPDQPYTFLATQWAWSAWQRARGVSGTLKENDRG